MKASEPFKKSIIQNLESLALKDNLFAETLKKENKNIDDCITYILNTVQKSGCNGFEKSEIFKMARHYYDEDDINIGGSIDAYIVVDHKVELTQEEIAEAKQKAINNVIYEEQKRMQKKTKPSKEQIQELKETQSSLF